MSSKVAAKVILALAITATFAWLVATAVDTDMLLYTIRSADVRWIALGTAATLATTLLRAIRLSLVLDGRLASSLIAISVAHNATTALLPMKLGEFMLPLLLSRARGMDVSSGLGILILLRMLDMLALGLLGAAAALLAFGAIGEASAATIAAIALAGALTVTLLLFLGWHRLQDLARHDGRHITVPVLSRAAYAMTAVNRGQLLRSYAYSLAIWIALFTAFYCFSRAIIVEVSSMTTATIGAAASLAFAFPISGVANVGPFQAAWVWMSLPFGIAPEPALAASMLSHGMVVLATAALAIALLPLLLKAVRATS
ncbi:lysylphosphatidylglycerol synthase transmembrane domain-containing protein [Coralloluteibacterium thermophilus]|uniref:Lysylphosphatidylglycerol synthase transmembrane domain-containing protein n=1 Tax=Coralloluteibacterium thermophilum TaxID=2707049 RepID=A0ABV9NFW1_9GAMM